MTKSIYDQHRAAFDSTSAYVIAKNGRRVGTIAFKFPRDGAGRLYCYLHVLGVEMVRDFAAGGGYDKKTAAAMTKRRQRLVMRREKWKCQYTRPSNSATRATSRHLTT